MIARVHEDGLAGANPVSYAESIDGPIDRLVGFVVGPGSHDLHRSGNVILILDPTLHELVEHHQKVGFPERNLVELAKGLRRHSTLRSETEADCLIRIEVHHPIHKGRPPHRRNPDRGEYARRGHGGDDNHINAAKKRPTDRG